MSAGACGAVLLLEGNRLPKGLSGFSRCWWKWQHQGSEAAERLKRDGGCRVLLPLYGCFWASNTSAPLPNTPHQAHFPFRSQHIHSVEKEAGIYLSSPSQASGPALAGQGSSMLVAPCREDPGIAGDLSASRADWGAAESSLKPKHQAHPWRQAEANLQYFNKKKAAFLHSGLL